MDRNAELGNRNSFARLRSGSGITKAGTAGDPLAGKKRPLLTSSFLADFRGTFHDIRNDPRLRNCLDANSYHASRRLAGELLEDGSAGVVYPSVDTKWNLRRVFSGRRW